MDISYTGRKRFRKSFGRIPEVAPMPNLIELQKSSYDSFLQYEVQPEDREDVGLQAAFRSIFPVKDYAGKAQLEFIKYSFENPKFDVSECGQRGGTYAVALRATYRLILWETEEATGARTIKDIKEKALSLLEEVSISIENDDVVSFSGIEAHKLNNVLELRFVPVRSNPLGSFFN